MNHELASLVIAPLPRLRTGCVGVIREVLSADDDVRRLQAMGICRGRQVMLVRRGDPMILRVLGVRIGVSERLAARVRVEACEDAVIAHDGPTQQGGA